VLDLRELAPGMRPAGAVRGLDESSSSEPHPEIRPRCCSPGAGPGARCARRWSPRSALSPRRRR
jgi:hypothetical protein